MEFRTTITLLRDATQKDEMLASLTFAPRPGEKSLFVQQDIPIPGSTPVTISSALMSNGNLSFAVFFGGLQVLLASARWDSVAPYFGVRLLDVGFLQAFFEKRES